jgi:hypothetical protein
MPTNLSGFLQPGCYSDCYTVNFVFGIIECINKFAAPAEIKSKNLKNEEINSVYNIVFHIGHNVFPDRER